MSVSREAIAAYLHAEFGNLAEMVGQADNDASPTGYGPDINNALRQLGESESALPSATVDDSRRDDIFALAEYYTARRMWRRLSDRANVKVDDSQFDYRQVLTNAKLLVDDAKAKCQQLGYDVTAGGWSVGALNLDWLEAESTGRL